ncbi:hypothetical protein BD626DRAFT_564481 [Schizophyllum amplum]|uniref:Uncharacterized protein n=1 Tax=Schizophyllum amplum TaxID=97359 RepID=A0A550CS03_9AGAR|nr:hypothetical protein BD626DRAFT_564481 [Auriculariopsis ampla]
MASFPRMKASVRSACAHIALNRTTRAFFALSVIYCIAQGVLQAFMYALDGEYAALAGGVTKAAGMPPRNVTDLHGSPGALRLEMCSDLPGPCEDIFRSGETLNMDGMLESHADGLTVGLDLPRHLPLIFVPMFGIGADNTTVRGVQITSASEPGISVFLNERCAQTVVYLRQHMDHAKAEDLTLIFLQLWLLAISLFALLKDSVPHILGVLAARALITGWSAYAVWRTLHQRAVFYELLVAPGTPCTVDFFPSYFNTRVGYEIADLVLMGSALLIAAYLSWHMLRLYSAQTFKCLGAPKGIMRINKLFMAVLACLQLEVFVQVTGMGLWADQLFNTGIKDISEHTVLYETLIVASAILLIPWIMLGWYAIRREMKRAVLLFLFLGFLYLFAWVLMFYSVTYRWLFVSWPFLGAFTVASVLLIVASIVLAIICRLHFDRGLRQYLQAESTLARAEFAPDNFSFDTRADKPTSWVSTRTRRSSASSGESFTGTSGASLKGASESGKGASHSGMGAFELEVYGGSGARVFQVPTLPFSTGHVAERGVQADVVRPSLPRGLSGGTNIQSGAASTRNGAAYRGSAEEGIDEYEVPYGRYF